MSGRRMRTCWAAVVFAVGFAFASAGTARSADAAGSPGRAAEAVDPSGTWTWVRELEGQEGQSVLKLSSKDGKLSGTYKRAGQVVPISNARFDKNQNQISFDADGKWNDQKVHGKFKGKLSRDAKGGDEINGTVEIVVEDGSLPLPWVARRGADMDDILGAWKLKLVTPNGETVEPQLKLSQEDGVLKGAYTSSRFGEHEAKQLKLEGQQLSWTVELERDGQALKVLYKGKLDASGNKGTIKGTAHVDAGGNTTALDFSGERTPPAPAAGPTKAGAAKPADGKSSSLAPAKRRVIVMLKSRREVLVIYSSAGKRGGPAFAIRSIDGKEIAKELSLKNLESGYPELYRQYRSSFANAWAGE